MNNSSAEKQATKFHYALLGLLIILGSIERIYGIDRQSLWGDELYAVMASYKYHFYNIWPLLVNDSHPPLYVTLMYWILPWTGYTDVGIRSLSLLYGLLWIPLIFWLGKRWFSVNVGLLAATLVTSAYSAIYFSQEARAYSMLITFSMANLICFLEILFATKPHREYTKGFIIASTLMLYLHYSGFVFISAEVLLYVILHVTKARRGSRREMQIIFGVPLLLYSPWLGFMYNHLTDQSRQWAVSGVPTIKDVYFAFLYLWGPDNAHLRYHTCSLFAATLFALYVNFRNGFTRLSGIIYVLLFLLIIPALAFYVESQVWTPIFEKRYFLTTLPIATLLTAIITDRIMQSLISPPWQKLSVLLAIISISVWTISANIDKKLYSEMNKDPFRDAVNVVKADLGTHITTNEYTVIMTHDGFEHYLNRTHIHYDKNWPFRIYVVPQKIGEINQYLKDRPQITYFYYLAFKQPDSDAAMYVLKQQYKLLSKAALTTPTAEIDIFKFSAKESPSADQINNSGTNPTNEAIKLIAQEVAHKDPKTYTTIMTHDWIEPYLHQNNVQVDEAWAGKMFYLDVHSAGLSDYLQSHPAIDTVYYVALREASTENAILILELQYQLISKRTIDTSIGKLDIFKFNTKIAPIITPEQKQQIQSNPINKAAALAGKIINNANPASYAVIMAQGWFEPYLTVNGVHIDKSWNERKYTSDFQAEPVFAYVGQHTAIDTLYYLVLRDKPSTNGLFPLLLKYQLLSYNAVDSPLGKLEIFQFKTKGKNTSDTTAFDAELAKNPVNLAASWIAKQVGSTKPDNYLILTTYQWYNLFLRHLRLDVDRAWPGHNYSNELQTEEVFSYVAAHPMITDLYYMALHNTDTERTIALLQSQYQLVSQNAVESPIGNIDTLRFNTKQTPANINSFKAKLVGSPLSDSAQWIARDITKTPEKKYTTLVSHNWFQPFLQIHGVQVDKTWNGRFVYQTNQVSEVARYLNTHPDISIIYYLALFAPDTAATVDALNKRAHFICQRSVEAPSLGRIGIMKFNVKEVPSNSNTTIPVCSE